MAAKTNQQLYIEELQHDLNTLTQRLYRGRDEKTLAYIYQTGFLLAILASLANHDSTNRLHIRRVIKRALARTEPKD